VYRRTFNLKSIVKSIILEKNRAKRAAAFCVWPHAAERINSGSHT
jgi:hypothetical protein